MATDATVLVAADGRGDEPAGTLRYFRNGVLELVVTQTWKASWRGWDLRRRETSKPDGSYRDVIEVERNGDLTGNGTLAPELTLAMPSAFGQSPEARAQDICDETGDPCADKYEDWQDALSDAYWSTAEMILFCAVIPPPFDLVACSVAAAHALRDARTADTKRDRYFDGGGETSVDPRLMMTAAGTLSGGFARASSCDPPDSGGGGSDDGEVTCDYWVEYDLVTGDIISVTLLGCYMM